MNDRRFWEKMYLDLLDKWVGLNKVAYDLGFKHGYEKGKGE